MERKLGLFWVFALITVTALIISPIAVAGENNVKTKSTTVSAEKTSTAKDAAACSKAKDPNSCPKSKDAHKKHPAKKAEQNPVNKK